MNIMLNVTWDRTLAASKSHIRPNTGTLATLVLVGVFFSLQPRAVALANPISASEQLGRYAEALSRIEAAYSSIVVSGRLASEYHVGQQAYKREVETLTVKRGIVGKEQFIRDLIDDGGQPNLPRRVVMSACGAYFFALRHGATDKDYQLIDFRILDEPVAPPEMSRYTFFTRLPYSTLMNTRMSEFINDPGFKLREVKSVTLNEKEMIEFRFDFRSLDRKSLLNRVRSGSFAVSPNKGWALCSMMMVMGPSRKPPVRKTTSTDSEVKSLSIRYEGINDGVPVLKEAIIRTGSSRFTFTVDQIKFREPPEKDFRLASFGLSEPAASRRTGTPWKTALLFLLLALVAFLGALAAKYYAERLSKRAKASA